MSSGPQVSILSICNSIELALSHALKAGYSRGFGEE
jgi:hypothetical protein